MSDTSEVPVRRGLAGDRALIWFMRAMAMAWIAKGLLNWLVILGHPLFGGPALDSLPLGARAAVIAFAVLDLVAGVGLWLTSTWGGVMWLLAVMCHLLVGVLGPGGPEAGGLVLAVEVALVFVYIGLSWLASREV